MNTDVKLSSEEQRAYDLITARDGILQTTLWKELNATSRKGSRLATSLAEKGLIDREETVNKGHTTYWLTPTTHAHPSTSSTTWTEPGSQRKSDDVSEGEETNEVNLNSREERALSLIQEQNGTYQSELWKELDVSSRTGSRIASSLEEKELIRREETTYNGQQTYLLLPARENLDFSLLMAGEMISPFIGSDEVDPVESDAFTNWLLNLL